MAEKVASLYAEIGADTTGLQRGLTDAERSLTGSAKSMEGGFSSLIGTLTKVAAAAVAVGTTMKKAFELGEQGAQILQVEASFNALLKSIGAAPDTLEKMQLASRGMISDMELMKNASILLAGTTGDLGKAYADALPQLMDIAVAAHALDPAAGDIDYFFNSLTRGLKRSSPLILDNLHLLIKVGDANEEYAAKIGKSADELTEAEQKQALLNAVLREGSTIVQQAGSATLDSTIKIDRMKASVSNLADTIKTKFTPAATFWADAIYYMIEGQDAFISDLQTTEKQIFATSSSYDEYRSKMDEYAASMGKIITAEGNLVGVTARGGESQKALIEGYAKTSQAAWDAAKAEAGLASATGEASEAAWDGTASWDAYGKRLQGLADEYAEYISAMQTWVDENALQAALQGTVQDAYEGYQTTLADLVGTQGELTASLVDLQERGISPTATAYQELQLALQENIGAQTEALAAFQRTTAEMMYQQVQSKLSGDAALELGRALGVVSEADYALSKIAGQLVIDLDMNANSMIDAGYEASAFAAAMQNVVLAAANLAKANLPITADNIAKELESMATTNADAELQDTASAASEATAPLSDVALAAANAAGEVAGVASATDDQNAALNDVKSAAANARGGLDSARSAASTAYGPLNQAAGAAQNLADSLRSIPRSTNIKVKTSGIGEAISDLRALAAAANAVPRNITINAKVISSTVPAAQYGAIAKMNQAYIVGESGPELFIPSTGGVILPHNRLGQIEREMGVEYSGGSVTYIEQNTYNVYNPLAAAMLTSRHHQEIEARVGQRMA